MEKRDAVRPAHDCCIRYVGPELHSRNHCTPGWPVLPPASGLFRPLSDRCSFPPCANSTPPASTPRFVPVSACRRVPCRHGCGAPGHTRFAKCLVPRSGQRGRSSMEERHLTKVKVGVQLLPSAPYPRTRKPQREDFPLPCLWLPQFAPATPIPCFQARSVGRNWGVGHVVHSVADRDLRVDERIGLCAGVAAGRD